MFHAQIAQRAFNAPLMVEPSKALAFLSGLGPRIVGGELRLASPQVDARTLEAAGRPARASILGDELGTALRREGARPFTLRDGIAVIEVTGALIHRGAWLGKSSGQTSYEGIAAQIDAAATDEDVRGIALDIDSFGGEVAGAFGLADRIRAARAVKPVRAFVAEHAYSAAYALASQADRIVIPRTGGAGSIGVVVMHADFSRMLESEGVSVTLIHSGAHKVDANPYAPLPEGVQARIQTEIDELRTLFAATVAQGRGARLTAAAALATEAGLFTGQAAIDAGLADALAEPREAFAAFAAELRATSIPRNATPGRAQGSRPLKETKMSEHTDTAADAATPESAAPGGDTQATAPAEAPPAPAAAPDAHAPAAAPAGGGERARIAAILDAPQAAGRTGLARHLALNTDLAPEAACAILEAAAAEAQPGGLGAAMAEDDSDLGPAPGAPARGEGMGDVIAARFG